MKIHELVDWMKLGITAKDMGAANDLIEVAIRVDKPDPNASMYRMALDEAGYFSTLATEQAVRDCFADYVDAGNFVNVEMDDIEDISTQEMCFFFLGPSYKSIRRSLRDIAHTRNLGLPGQCTEQEVTVYLT